MEEELFVLLTFAASWATTITFGIAWRRARRREQKLIERLMMQPETTPRPRGGSRVEARLEELAAQVDQLAKGQDFLHQIVRNRSVRALPKGLAEATPQ